jgi:hypothetical protein
MMNYFIKYEDLDDVVVKHEIGWWQIWETRTDLSEERCIYESNGVPEKKWRAFDESFFSKECGNSRTLKVNVLTKEEAETFVFMENV